MNSGRWSVHAHKRILSMNGAPFIRISLIKQSCQRESKERPRIFGGTARKRGSPIGMFSI
jgi:hypothetical protein